MIGLLAATTLLLAPSVGETVINGHAFNLPPKEQWLELAVSKDVVRSGDAVLAKKGAKGWSLSTRGTLDGVEKAAAALRKKLPKSAIAKGLPRDQMPLQHLVLDSGVTYEDFDSVVRSAATGGGFSTLLITYKDEPDFTVLATVPRHAESDSGSPDTAAPLAAMIIRTTAVLANIRDPRRKPSEGGFVEETIASTKPEVVAAALSRMAATTPDADTLLVGPEDMNVPPRCVLEIVRACQRGVSTDGGAAKPGFRNVVLVTFVR